MNFEITRLTEELSKERNASKEWAALYGQREEEHVKASSKLVTVEEKLSKASKEWAAIYRKMEDEHIKTSSKLITLEEELLKARNTIALYRPGYKKLLALEKEADGLRKRNERQAERLRFFRGMGCPPPIEELEELEVDPE